MLLTLLTPRTILTHFSQRYPRLPEGLDPLATPLSTRPVTAFDGMCVLMSGLPLLPLVMPALAAALVEVEAEGEGGGGKA